MVPFPATPVNSSATSLFADHSRHLRQTAFWEALAFAAFGLCGLATMALAFLLLNGQPEKQPLNRKEGARATIEQASPAVRSGSL